MMTVKSVTQNGSNSTNTGAIGLLFLCLLLIFPTGNQAEEIPAASRSDTIEDTIKRSADYLVKATKNDGMFEYRINMDPTVKVNQKYNILRHAGTIYAMSMYHERHPDKQVRSAIERAGKYLRDESILPLPGSEDMLGVWSKPEVNHSGKPLEIKLGGTGLGLVALLSIEKISPGFTPLPKLQALGRSIVYMQKEDGSFSSKYIPSMGGLQHGWQSLYYPGEAALGLLMLYAKDPSEIWLKSAYKALEYLARGRENSKKIPADHWALLATERLLSLENRHQLPISKKLLINHTIQICESMLKDQVTAPFQIKFDGGFSRDGRTTPTSTRLEGLLAALSYLPQDHVLRKPLLSSMERGITFLLRAQISEGEFAGAFPRSVSKKPVSSPKAIRFNSRVSEVRIDYVQHAMSALIQYQRLTETNSGRNDGNTG